MSHVKHGYLCQFCGARSLAQEWVLNTCPKCEKVYDQSTLSPEESRRMIYFVEGQDKKEKENE